MFVLIYAAAAAVAAGGAAGSRILWNEAKRREALFELQRTAALREEAIRLAGDAAELDRQARAKGVDPEQVRKGIDAMLEGRVSIDDVMRFVSSAA